MVRQNEAARAADAARGVAGRLAEAPSHTVKIARNRAPGFPRARAGAVRSVWIMKVGEMAEAFFAPGMVQHGSTRFTKESRKNKFTVAA